MITYNLTTAPASYPVALADVKAAADVTFTDDDDLLNALIAAATGVVEEMTGKSLIAQSWTRTSEGVSGKTCISLKRPPVTSLTSITYYDGDNSSQTFDTANVYLVKDEDRAIIEPIDSWPTMYDRPDALAIEFASGYSTVPPELVQAIKMLVAEWYDNNLTASEAKRMEVPFGVSTLVGLRKKGWVSA